jgi:hypothetical protein
MDVGSFVLVHLVNPREKFWGILRAESVAGVTVRGLTLEGFEGWLREIAHREPLSFHPATVFFPLHRVERIFADGRRARLLRRPVSQAGGGGRPLLPDADTRRAVAPARGQARR